MYATSKDIALPFSAKTAHSNIVLAMKKLHAFRTELIYLMLVTSSLVIRMVIDSMWPAFHAMEFCNLNSNVLM